MNYLVTGCSKGLGLEICRILLQQGHVVYGVARSHTSEFQCLERDFPNQLHFKSVDLSDSGNVRNSVFNDFLCGRVPIDGVVNNAAVAYDDILTNLDVSRVKAMYEVNVFTPMVITKYAIRRMLLLKNSLSIVHVSSVSAHTGYKGLSMYASSKGAIEAFSKNTAREWGALGVRSNVVVPGFMETEMSSGLSDEQKDKIYRRTSLKKATNVRSVAETVAFLLSEKAESISGQNIFVDSGTI